MLLGEVTDLFRYRDPTFADDGRFRHMGFPDIRPYSSNFVRRAMKNSATIARIAPFTARATLIDQRCAT